ncbi:MAG: energy-coupling factor transporter transmembrane protein EcfT [Candidatus Caldarchaeum sp.]|nr:energy-coupling factor transporter transmembrane protein EcfT [Candidatus Caldarchaeum sp.]
MSLFEGLRFRPGNTFVHRLDPRVKLAASTMILATAVIYVDVVVVLTLLFLEALVIFSAKVHGLWVKTLRGAVPLAVIVFAITFFSQYSREPDAFVAAGYALAYALRLVVFLSSFSLFFLTTTPDEIALTLQQLRIPYEYTFAFVSAIRFTPVMAEELKVVMDAQRARGLELDKGPVTKRIRNLIPILVPLLVNVIRRSYELAEAMEVKCFGASRKRTSLKVLDMKPKDYFFFTVVLALFSAGLAVKVLGIEPVKTIPLFSGLFPS